VAKGADSSGDEDSSVVVVAFAAFLLQLCPGWM